MTKTTAHRTLPKAPTGIAGLDEITEGGLPRGRPTLVCGGPGCGKTLLAMEFLVRGATEFGEPGVFMVVDLYQQPEQAQLAQIIAAPTLVKELPLPLQRLIGDLTDPDRLLIALNLKPKDG